MPDLPTNQAYQGTGIPCFDCRVRELARELLSLGVNVAHFLEQALSGERIVRSVSGLAYNDAFSQSASTAGRFADAIRNDAEWSHVPFAPSFLWHLHYLRNKLWEGKWSELNERDFRASLEILTDALRDRRTNTHNRPTPGGVIARRDHGEALALHLAWIADSAVRTLKAFAPYFTVAETADCYLNDLREAQFWERLRNEDPIDPERPDGLLRHELERDFFDDIAHRERPHIEKVVVAMVTALLEGEVDPAIFGGSGKPDKRVTSRSLAIRALRKVCPENLGIPRK